MSEFDNMTVAELNAATERYLKSAVLGCKLAIFFSSLTIILQAIMWLHG